MDNFFRRVFHEDLPAFLGGGAMVGLPSIHFLFADPPYATELWILVVKFLGLCGTVMVSGLLTVLSKDLYLFLKIRIKKRIFNKKPKQNEQIKKDAA